MIRTYIFLALLLSMAGFSYGQDLIVTVKGDSIQGKVIRQDSISVRFTDVKKGGAEWEMSKSMISGIIIDFYLKKEETSTDTPLKVSTSQIVLAPRDTIPMAEPDSVAFLDSIVVKISRPHYWRFNFYGGLGYRLARPQINSTQAELEYVKDLKSGTAFGTEIYFLRWNKIGVGMRYDMYMSRGAMNQYNKDDIRISFTGASVVYHTKLKNEKNELITGFWLGYQPYKNKAVRDSVDTRLSAKTMGWGVSVGVSHQLSKKFAISLTGACFLSTAYKLKQTVRGREEEIELSYDHVKDLTRASLTLGLTFR